MGHEQLPILEYHAEPSPVSPWLHILRAFVMGPMTGALVGFAQASAAVVLCHFDKECSFYSHGQATVFITALTFGGGIVGVPYVFALIIYEYLCSRRILISLVMPSLLVPSCAAEVVVLLQYPRADSLLFFAPQAMAVLFGLILSGLLSRKVSVIAARL